MRHANNGAGRARAANRRARISSGTLLVLVIFVVVVLVTVYFALAMPGMDHSPNAPHEMENMLPSNHYLDDRTAEYN